MEYSKNERAEKIAGKRKLDGAIPFDQPCELGYHCPVCEYELVSDGNFDERLGWSEYNGFLWCAVCNVDYPSCLCLDKGSELPSFYKDKDNSNIERAISIYLDCIEETLNNK